VAATIKYFMLPEDERALFRMLARKELTLYPEIFPPGTAGIPVDDQAQALLVEEAYYLAAERHGPVIVRPLARGRDRGMLEIEELPSPVFHYERSLPNEKGELVGGRLWSELDVNDDPGSRVGKPVALRQIFEEVNQFFRKSWRRSDPKGWWVGPVAGGAVKGGRLVLREPGHHGRTVGVWR
jgi:hypothetical protein